MKCIETSVRSWRLHQRRTLRTLELFDRPGGFLAAAGTIVVAAPDSPQPLAERPQLAGRGWLVCVPGLERLNLPDKLRVLCSALGTHLVADLCFFGLGQLVDREDPGVAAHFLHLLGQPAQLLEMVLGVGQRGRPGGEACRPEPLEGPPRGHSGSAGAMWQSPDQDQPLSLHRLNCSLRYN